MALLGRSDEQGALRALMSNVAARRGGALVLRGEPGAGKTALLSTAVKEAPELQHIWTNGVPMETQLPFAALHRLLRPIMHYMAHLPEPQESALAAALGEARGPSRDQFRTFLGVLGVLAEAAHHKPLVAIVDDAQWLDPSSAAAVSFVSRRIGQEPIGLLFATSDEAGPLDTSHLDEITVAGLGEAHATQLIQERSGGQVAPEVVRRLVRRTGGSPLALAELAESLSLEQLDGRAALPRLLPVPEDIESGYLGRVRALSDNGQRLLLLAAADEVSEVPTLTRAARLLGVPAGALDELERSSLLRVTNNERVQLRHPLLRSAVYNAATMSDRQQAHRALAAVLGDAADDDRRAWHLAASVSTPDPRVVAELDRTAFRARRRGAHETAAAAWQRAAELSLDPAARARRRFAAAQERWIAYEPERAAALARAALAEASDPRMVADLTRLQARIEWASGSMRLGHQILCDGAAAVFPHDPVRALEMAMLAAQVVALGGRSGSRGDPAGLAGAVEHADSSRTRCCVALLRGFVAVADGHWSHARDHVHRALRAELDLEGADQDLIPTLAIAALLVGDLEAADTYHRQLLLRARRSNALLYVVKALNRLTLTDIAAGRWTDVDLHAGQALALSEVTLRATLSGLPRAARLLVSALRADAGYDERLKVSEQDAATGSLVLLELIRRDLVHWAKGVRAEESPGVALHHLSNIAHPLTQRLAALERIEAAVRAGRRGTAEMWVADIDEFGRATQQVWARAVAEHGRALLTESRKAEEHFRKALHLHAGSPRVFDRARTQLAYGQMLRRSHRRVDAREPLREAMQTFADLQADYWRARAVNELRAAGESPGPEPRVQLASLTPQERQVTTLVCEGLTNQDVAERLVLSRRTVDFHLRNVYAKTGVTSRLELSRLMLS